MLRFLLAVLLAVPPMVVQSAARAAPDPLDRWTTYPCPAGTLDPATMKSESLSDSFMVMTVTGRLGCALPASEPDQFGVGVFPVGWTSATVYPGMRQRYATTAPTVFTTSVPVQLGKRLGMCLFADVTPPLSCVVVTAGVDGTPTAELLDPKQWPQAADAPRNADPRPQCNTCWATTPV